MKLKNRYKDLTALGIIFLLCAAVIVSCVKKGSVYGSQIDWASQHYLIPEYFRTLFYHTHKLFPSYAANLGAGENIYVLSYYGLYSPIIVFSYLFPFIPMGVYMTAAGIAIAFGSSSIFYFFLRKRYQICAAAFAAASYAFSAPLLLHTHRHIMFMCYMPFLLLSMHFTDRYFQTGKRYPLVLCAFLMIMCNFFFAVSAMLSLAAYGLYAVLERRPGSVRACIRRYVPFLLLLAVSVMMACVLLLPTGYTLLSGRDEANTVISLRQFLPTIRLDWLTYYGYSMGSSVLGVFSAIYFAVNGRRGKRFIAILILLFAVFPFFLFLMNGTLYIDAKVLFAFLPLTLILTAELVKRIFSGRKMHYKLPAAILAGSVLLSIFTSRFGIPMWCLYADTAVTALVLVILLKRKNPRLIYLCLLMPFVVCCVRNRMDERESSANYNTVNSPTVRALTADAAAGKMVRTAIDTVRLDTVNKIYTASHYSDTIYSSVHSKDYNSFYLNEMYNENQFRNSALTTRSRSLIFNTYMGNRYYISNAPVDFYLHELRQQTDDGYYLYENPYAFPMLYCSDRVMSRRQYETLEYPYNIEALLRYRIIEQDIPDAEFVPHAERAARSELDGLFAISPYLSESERQLAHFSEDHYSFFLENGSLTYSCPLPEAFRGKIVLLRLYADNPKQGTSIGWETAGDIRIKINGQKNTLTDPDWKYYNHNHYFEFVISDHSDRLEIELLGSHFELSGLEAYTLDPQELCEASEALTPFVPDLRETGADVIAGSINAEHDGYFATSLVYHEGFTVYVDGTEVQPERVNLAFLGFPLREGTHTVRIEFRAPFLRCGLIISGAGAILFMILVILDIRAAKRKKRGRNPHVDTGTDPRTHRKAAPLLQKRKNASGRVPAAAACKAASGSTEAQGRADAGALR